MKTVVPFFFLAFVAMGQEVREKRIIRVDPVQSQGYEQRNEVGGAVLAGVGSYPAFSYFSELHYPQRDVSLMEQVLKSQRYTTVSLKDGDATGGAILNAISAVGRSLDPANGVLIFYFSGHGYRVGDVTYLAAHDSVANNLSKTGVSLKDIEKAMSDTGAVRRVLLIDACRTEPTKAGGERSFASFLTARGTLILYSTEGGAGAYEDDEHRQGLFSYYLVQGLRGAAAKSDNLISFRDLADYAIAATRKRSLELGLVQIPYAGGEASGDFLLARLTPDGLSKLNPKDGLRYVWIPAGSFSMGCSPGDAECDDDENPRHSVTIGQGFWIGQTPATVAAWRRYSKETGRPIPPGVDKFGRRLNGEGRDDSLPVVSMMHSEAAAFCKWAGLGLPTEAQWEYAARAGSPDSRYGDLDDIAWYGDNSGRSRLDTSLLWEQSEVDYDRILSENGNGPHPAAQKSPNAWDLYDMLGNVWQWTADWYPEADYGRLPAVATPSKSTSGDPRGVTTGSKRVLRGGSWVNFPSLVRVSWRERYDPSTRADNVGFRCSGPAF